MPNIFRPLTTWGRTWMHPGTLSPMARRLINCPWNGSTATAIVDLSDMLDDLDVFGPEDIEKRVEVRDGDILIINTGWHKYTFLAPDGDEERYIQRLTPQHLPMVAGQKDPRSGAFELILDRPPDESADRRFLGSGWSQPLAKGAQNLRGEIWWFRQGGEDVPTERYELNPQRALPP